MRWLVWYIGGILALPYIVVLVVLLTTPQHLEDSGINSRPTDLTCVGTDGHYRPANGRNYVILNDEWCK